MRNIQGVYQTKYYYGIVKKSKLSFSLHLKIDKKFNKKEDKKKKIQGEKLSQLLFFTCCLVLLSF